MFQFLLFSPVYIPLVISFVLFFNSEKNNKAKKTLALVLLNVAFLFFGLYFFLSGRYESYSKILFFNVASLLWVYPSVYIYIRRLIQPTYPIRRILLHLFPGIFALLQSIVYYTMLDAEGRLYFVKVFRYYPSWDNPILVIIYAFRIINLIVLFVQIFYYGLKSITILRKYDKTILSIYSNTESISLNSIKVINFALFVSSIACIAFYSINPIKIFGNYIALIIPLIAISIALWLLGIIGLRQKMIPEELLEEQIAEDRPIGPNPSSKYLYSKTIDYLEVSRVYLNPNLKIDDLVTHLGTNRTHLSNAINTFSGINFNRFINQYRITFAKEFTKKENSCSKHDVAIKSGFGSLRSFERNFKEIEGISYVDYLKNNNII